MAGFKRDRAIKAVDTHGTVCDIDPHFGANGVPYCTEACPAYDGKRCKVLGHRPDRVCVPAVEYMADQILAIYLAEEIHRLRREAEHP